MTAEASRIAVYTGAFDPLTLGHLDVILRGRKLFERLIVAVGINPQKQTLFSPDERVELIRQVVGSYPNIAVESFQNLAVAFAHERGARVLLRGLRTLSDMEYEFTMSLTNRHLDREIETVFLMASEEYSHISSTLIKQIALLGDRDQLRKFVPEPIIEPLIQQVRGQRIFDF